MKRYHFVFAVLACISLFTTKSFAQVSTTGANVISSGVPFLSIGPDSRAGAMGDVGAATTPDMNSQHWNPAKYAFVESEMGLGLSYTPWLRNLVDDINLAYLVGYKKLDDLQVLSASLRYFALGDIAFLQRADDIPVIQSPNEFAFDLGYTRLLSDYFSGSVALRYIHSDLAPGVEGMSAGNSYAADIAFYYQNEMRANRKRSIISAGVNISNIGSKISYDDGETKDFLPTNLKLGVGYKTEMDQYNTIGFYFDINKLLVPTPNDNAGIFEDRYGENKSVIAGMFSSFGDAPGGMKEELQEINLSFGAEYWYNKQFALRAGYFYENENKGNRKYFTAGAGLKLNVFALDFSYLIPTEQNNPLENTLRFSLSFDFDAFKNQK